MYTACNSPSTFEGIDTAASELHNLGANLRRVRVGHGWSLRQLEERCQGQVSHSTISRLERGLGEHVGLATLIVLARALAVPLSDLVGELQPRPTSQESEGEPVLNQLLRDLAKLNTVVESGEELVHQLAHLPATKIGVIADLITLEDNREKEQSKVGKEKRHIKPGEGVPKTVPHIKLVTPLERLKREEDTNQRR
jgi:transcriptional regulator with XRE-family HTH domain